MSESSTKYVENNNKGRRPNKISIRFRENSKQHDGVAEENRSSTPMDDSIPPQAAASAEDESLPKTWNLRPRRPPMNHKQSTGGPPKIGTSRLQEIKTSHETNIHKQLSELNTNNNSDPRKSKKQKFSIPLSRSEIEEDVFLLTGSKPSRRPKKRPRAIQRQLDVSSSFSVDFIISQFFVWTMNCNFKILFWIVMICLVYHFGDLILTDWFLHKLSIPQIHRLKDNLHLFSKYIFIFMTFSPNHSFFPNISFDII